MRDFDKDFQELDALLKRERHNNSYVPNNNNNNNKNNRKNKSYNLKKSLSTLALAATVMGSAAVVNKQNEEVKKNGNAAPRSEYTDVQEVYMDVPLDSEEVREYIASRNDLFFRGEFSNQIHNVIRELDYSIEYCYCEPKGNNSWDYIYTTDPNHENLFMNIRVPNYRFYAYKVVRKTDGSLTIQKSGLYMNYDDIPQEYPLIMVNHFYEKDYTYLVGDSARDYFEKYGYPEGLIDYNGRKR